MSDANSTKYRLAGAVVILISLMVAWYLLVRFDEHRIQQVSSKHIPEPIIVETFDVPLLKTEGSEIVALPLQAQDSGLPIDRQQEPQAKKTLPISTKNKNSLQSQIQSEKFTELNESHLPQAWVLQVGSFNNETNAKKLQQLLLQDEYPAYVKAFNVNNKQTYRVLVGPKLNKKRAILLSESIVKKYQLKSLIIEYKPGFSE